MVQLSQVFLVFLLLGLLSIILALSQKEFESVIRLFGYF